MQSVSNLLVTPTLSANVTDVVNGEASLLNSTANSALASASNALMSDGLLASSYATSSQAILGATLSGFSGSFQATNSLASSLNTQSSGTSIAMSKASAYLISDLNARTDAINSAVASITQANSDFSSLQVAKGVSLLVQASVSFSLASSQG